MRIGSRVAKVPDDCSNAPDGTPLGSVIAIERDSEDSIETVTIRWDDGRIETTAIMLDDAEIIDVTPICYLNLYLHDRQYGGPEEGGWWYDTYAPVVERDWWDEDPPQHGHFATPEAAEAAMDALQAWCNDQNSRRRSPSSVLSDGHFVVRLEAWPAEHYPVNRPYYC